MCPAFDDSGLSDFTTASLVDWVSQITAARERISQLAKRTPVTQVTDVCGVPVKSTRVFLKLENLQRTGSFKLRGAANRVLSLSSHEGAAGVVTASNGNHGLGVAVAAHHRRIVAEVFVSAKVSSNQCIKMQEYGAHIRKIGQNPLEAELAARQSAGDSGRTYISPYNDYLVVAGNGTIGAELTEQVDHIDAIYVAVGCGGLVSGIGSYLKALSPRTLVIGCWPEQSRVLFESLKAGSIIEFPEGPTLSESTAGGIEPGSITFDLSQRVIDRCVLVSESEILSAMRWARNKGWIVEGAAGAAIAAFAKNASCHQGKTVVVVSCGGNLSPEVAKRLE